MARIISIWFAEPQGQEMLLWLRRYTPYVRSFDEREFALDVSGWSQAFGAEGKLVADLSRRLDATGLLYKLAEAGTLTAARMLTSYAWAATAPTQPNEIAAAIGPLPVAALDLEYDVTRALETAGFAHIEDIYAVDRETLPARLGVRGHAEAVLGKLDQALGRRPEPFTADEPPPRYISRLSISGLSQSAGVLAAGVDRLLADLSDQLRADGNGARRIVLQAFGAAGMARDVSVTSATAGQAAADLRAMLIDQLVDALPDAGFDSLAVEAHRCGPMERATKAPALPDRAPGTLASARNRIEAARTRADAISFAAQQRPAPVQLRLI